MARNGPLALALEVTVDTPAFLHVFVRKGHRSFDKFIVDEGAVMNFSVNIGSLARAIQVTVVILAFLHISPGKVFLPWPWR